MLLTITCHENSDSELSYLLHKHPERVQEFRLNFGSATVFYPSVLATSCTACLLLNVDPVRLVRNRRDQHSFQLGSYVNDRTFVASSFMSVAIAQVFGSALAGRCKQKPDLPQRSIPLTAKIDVLPVRSDRELLSRLFEPLGYEITTENYPLDENFKHWGDSHYYSVSLSGTAKLADLLSHLYVLIPVFDDFKHYFVGEDELSKLLAKGEGWLRNHPAKEQISRRYLQHRPSLFKQALQRLDEPSSESINEHQIDHNETNGQQRIYLNQQRYDAVLSQLGNHQVRSVIDLGCGEGKLIRQMLGERQLRKIVGVDVSIRALEIASRRLKVDRDMCESSNRVQLLHGSLTYRDDRFSGFEAATLIEVIEHLDMPRLAALERVLFEFARPKLVIVTTPNHEYNAVWENLQSGQYRHSDHRFEWSREEFQNWAQSICQSYGYKTEIEAIGPVDEHLGSPTQMAVLTTDEYSVRVIE